MGHKNYCQQKGLNQDLKTDFKNLTMFLTNFQNSWLYYLPTHIQMSQVDDRSMAEKILLRTKLSHLDSSRFLLGCEHLQFFKGLINTITTPLNM